MAVTEMTQLAVDGGPRAFTGVTGKAEPKIGMEEFMSIAERFGFSPEALRRLEQAVSNADLPPGGPNLARYLCASPAAKGPQFEALARKKFGVKHALSTSSGTGALHSAFVAAGVEPGKQVILPALGFMATASAVALAGGTPVFCDVDESMQIDPSRIEPLINENTVAVAPTHHFSGIADMDGVMAVARKHGLKVVEDCAQSPGGKFRGKYVGTIGDLGCFSISAYKIIGGGEGGMVVTNDERLYERANQLAECGGLWRSNRFAPPRYEGELFVGTNYRMSEMEAAIDLVQLDKLDDVVRRFHDNKMRILRQLKTYREIVPQKINDPEGDVGYILRFYPETHELGTRIAKALNAEGVLCGARGEKADPDWHIYHDMFPVVQGAGKSIDPRAAATYRRGACPVADDLYNRCVSVWLDQWYSPQDCDAVARGIDKVLGAYCTEDPSARAWI